MIHCCILLAIFVCLFSFVLYFGFLYSDFFDKDTPIFSKLKKRRLLGQTHCLTLSVLRKPGVRYSFMVQSISDLRRAHQMLVKAEPTFHSSFKSHVGDIWQESFYFRSGTVFKGGLTKYI